jgi:outer membrane protein insertion porin family
MRASRLASLALLLLLLLCPPPPARAQGEPPIVRDIEIRFVGPPTVNRAVIHANIQTEVGKPRHRELIEQDVRDLIATGHFFDVRVIEEPLPDGVKIIYQVQGRAAIKEITFEGNNRFKNERLARELGFKTGDTLDERKVHVAKRKITELYHKAAYPDVVVDHEIAIDRDTGQALVRYKIQEGPRVFLKRIAFTGNEAFDAKRLQRLMKTRYRWWGSWLARTGVIKHEVLREDLELLREHYRSHGYLDMEVRDWRIQRISEKWMVLHIDLFEGRQYKVGHVAIQGNRLFPTAELERQLKMTTDETFTPGGLSADIRALEDYYGSRGYLDTSVRATRVANIETSRIDLDYTIREGELTYIHLIEIRGNTKTKDKVIRRELAVEPGEVFDTVRVDRSAERLRNLGYFSRVDTMPQPTDIPNRRDLVISVEEQRTGTVTFGAGFSSIDNFIGFVEVTQGNFDLFNPPTFTGGGQKLRLRVQLGFERQDYVLSFTEPWFLDQRLALGFDAFRRSSRFLSDDFTETRTGGAVRLEKGLTEFIRVGLEYNLQNIELDVSRRASAELQSQDGTLLRSAVAASLVYDSRDSVFLTLRGNRTELGAEVAGGPWGGDVSIYKLTGKTTFYFPFFNKHVLQLIAAGGVVDAYGASRGDNAPFNDVPIFDRFFLGGANTLRGFSFRKVGPKDENREPVGGNTYVYGTVEYTFPIIERVRGALFFDIGEVREQAYSFAVDDLRANVGVGVRLNLPIGPIRLDYGHPVWTDSATGKSGKIQFSVGYQF